MSSEIINKDNLSIELINKNHLKELKTTLLTQRNDPICKLLKDIDIKLNIDDYINVSCLDIPEELILKVDKDGDITVGELFEYLKSKYPFIVTVDSKYGNLILGKGTMLPVEPSDEPGNFGFKGTIGIDPFIEKENKRYIVSINSDLYDNLYPFFPYNEACYKNGILDRNILNNSNLEHNPFKGVGFLPFSDGMKLQNIKNYTILGLYSGNELNNILLEEELNQVQDKLVNIL